MLNEPTHSNQLLQSILDCVGVGLIVTDRQGRIQLSNPAAEAILGVGLAKDKVDEWLLNCGMFQSEQEAPLADEDNPILSAMRGGSVSKQEVYVRNDKLPLGAWCSINVRPLFDNDGKTTGGIIVIQNVTEQKRLALGLERSNRDLQEFAYVAAHDLQEPLRTITGFGDLLEANMRDKLDEKSADQLKRMLAAAKRMQTLISALLKFARVETKHKESTSCDPKSIIDEAVSDLNSSIQNNNAVIDTKDLLPVKVTADRSQITQLFQNIIANSIKYRSEKDPVIQIRSRSLGAFVEFRVCDNGIGFDMQFAEKIFVLFKRLHTRAAYEGAGMGLSMCKKIVERHGGVIRAESSLGSGTCITFTLPKDI